MTARSSSTRLWHEEHLPAAPELVEHVLPHALGGEPRNLGADGVAARGRGRHDGGAGARRTSAIWSVRGMGVADMERVWAPVASFLSASFSGDAEAVLLVDHDEREAIELDVLREQAVGAERDIDLARGDPRPEVLQVLADAQPRQAFDGDREALESAGEDLEMLVRQDRRRRQNGDLVARVHGAEGGAHGDLGLAEPTSPHSRSIGFDCPRSSSTMVIASAWSGVSSKGKAAANWRSRSVDPARIGARASWRSA